MSIQDRRNSNWLREPSIASRRSAMADVTRSFYPGMSHPSLSHDFRSIPYPATGRESEPYFAGYMESISVTGGSPLAVHVATRSSESCFVDIYRVVGCEDARLSPRLSFVQRLGPVKAHQFSLSQTGRRLSSTDADAKGCEWPKIDILESIPQDWRSGIYVAQFNNLAAPTGRAAERAGQDALFIVRAGEPRSHLLYQVNVATWAAYHIWHNRSLYLGRTLDGARIDELRTGSASLHRPGLGICLPNETILTPNPPKATYAFAFIDWLEREGIEVDFCSGLDLSAGLVNLNSYSACITVGHDEYWTHEQQVALREFRATGGHTVFLGGNLAFWQIRASPDLNTIECQKYSDDPDHSDHGQHGESLDPAYGVASDSKCLTGQTWSLSESSTIPTTGVYNFVRRPGQSQQILTAGAFWWWEELGGPSRPACGFTICKPDHWIFHGLGLQYGDIVGEGKKLIGHESDGLQVRYTDERPALTFEDGALTGTELLAVADCRHWGEWDFGGWPPVYRAHHSQSRASLGGFSTMIYRQVPGEGMLFSAPTTDWVFGLLPTIDWTATRALEAPILPYDPAVVGITRNILNACKRKSG